MNSNGNNFEAISGSSLLHAGSAIMLLFCGSFVILVAHWLVWPYDVMQVKSVKVLTPSVEIGELFEYSLDYCKDARYASLYSLVQRSFVDCLIYNLPVEFGPLPAGCGTAIMTLIVPALPEGNYHLQIRRDYKVNPVRTITVEYTTGMFHVNGARRLRQMLEQQLPQVLPKVLPDVLPDVLPEAPASALPKN